MPITDKKEDLAMAFLGASESEWSDLVDRSIGARVRTLASVVVGYQDDLENLQKFWNMINEDSLLPKVSSQLNLLDRIRAATVEAVSSPEADDEELRMSLDYAIDMVKKSYTIYAKAEEFTLGEVRKNSVGRPKTSSFLRSIGNYWKYLDDFWPDIRKEVVGKWVESFGKTSTLLGRAITRLRPNEKSAHSILLKVSSLLRGRSSHFAAQKVEDVNDKIKQYYVKEEGLIPAYMGAQGNWKVARDDCPDHQLPEKETRLTEHFAFCRFNKEECPSFDRSRGSYVKCKSFIMLKEANLVNGIKKISSKKFLSSLEEIAETDPFVRSLFLEAERRTGALYYGNIVDDRLEDLLSSYSRSDRKGTYDYRVYTVADEPVLISGKHIVAADPVLIEMLSKGEQMPRKAATRKIASSVIRVTFTANAVRDPEFRDFLRKKNAKKTKHFTYDVPFDREEDINFFLQEVREEFDYKIEIFELLEDSETPIEKDFGVYNWNSFPLLRSSSARLALTYIPVAPTRKRVARSTYSPKAASDLERAASLLSATDSLRSRIEEVSDHLRVGAHILVALKTDVMHYASGAIGIIPDIGTHWSTIDPDTGANVKVELVRVAGRKTGKASKISYVVRSLDTGKEIRIASPWIREGVGCGCGEGPTPPHPMLKNILEKTMTPSSSGSLPPWAQRALEDAVAPAAPPSLPAPMVDSGAIPPTENAFGYVKDSGEGTVYLVRIDPKAMEPDTFDGGEEAPPPPFGRFPGDLPLDPPEMDAPPMMAPPMDMPHMMAPMDAPPMMAPPMDMPPMDMPHMMAPMDAPPMMAPPMAQEQHGPSVEGEDTYIAVDSEDSAEDDTDNEVLEDIKSKTAPGLTFSSSPNRKEEGPPASEKDNDIEAALTRLKKKTKGDPRVKNVRSSLGPKGDTVLYVHSTMPKTLRKELPTSVHGFELITAPVHEMPEDKNADSITNQMKNAPSNGSPTGPYTKGPSYDQESGPPDRGDVISVDRDFPPGS